MLKKAQLKLICLFVIFLFLLNPINSKNQAPSDPRLTIDSVTYTKLSETAINSNPFLNTKIAYRLNISFDLYLYVNTVFPRINIFNPTLINSSNWAIILAYAGGPSVNININNAYVLFKAGDYNYSMDNFVIFKTSNQTTMNYPSTISLKLQSRYYQNLVSNTYSFEIQNPSSGLVDFLNQNLSILLLGSFMFLLIVIFTYVKFKKGKKTENSNNNHYMNDNSFKSFLLNQFRFKRPKEKQILSNETFDKLEKILEENRIE